jgi:hypothetical protein
MTHINEANETSRKSLHPLYLKASLTPMPWG